MAVAVVDRQDTLTPNDGYLNKPYPVPSEDIFAVDGEEKMAQYSDAEDIHRIAQRLFKKYPDRFAHLRGVRIAYLWKRRAQAHHGKVILGQCVKLGGITEYFANAPFSIVINAATCGDADLTYYQMEALVFHELSHMIEDEDGNIVLVAHDFEAFADELLEYGPWNSDKQRIVDTVHRIPSEKVAIPSLHRVV